MSKKIKQKYYAIKEGKGVRNKIVTTWDECKDLVLGYASIYKSFSTEDAAREYLYGIKKKEQPIRKENVKVSVKSSKKRGFSTKSLDLKIPNDLYEKFIEKSEELGLAPDKILLGMIKEWIE